MTSLNAAPRLLIVEDDAELRETLQLMLSEEGYQVTEAASRAEALALLHQDTFDLVLTDLFRTPTSVPPESVLPILKHAAPTPVGIMTAWNLSEEKAQQAGFACLIRKPFDVDAFMATIAACIHQPLTPEQEQQARLVRDYIAAVAQYDFEQALGYVTEDVVYHAPAPTRHFPHFRLVRGKADFRAYLEQAAYFIRDFEVEQFSVFPHPTGLAVRYSTGWTAPDGRHQRLAASLVFHFEGELISRFGFQPGTERAPSA